MTTCMPNTKGNLNMLVACAHLSSFSLTTWSRGSVHAAKAERMTCWATLPSAHTSKVCKDSKESNIPKRMKWTIERVGWTAATRWICTQVLHTSHTGRVICRKPTWRSSSSRHAVDTSPPSTFWGSFSCFCEKKELLYRAAERATNKVAKQSRRSQICVRTMALVLESQHFLR